MFKMKNRWKSYLVFTSLAYRVLVYLGIPVVLSGMAAYVGRKLGGGAALVAAAVLLPMAEAVSDNWLFGGIHTKDTEKMDFLKTSGCGMRIMRNALGLDMLRKLITAVIVLGICCFAFPWINSGNRFEMGQKVREADEIIQMAVYGAGVSWFFSVLGTFLTRYGSQLWFNMIVGYGLVLLETVCWFLPGLEEHLVLYALLYLALGIGVSLLAVNVAMKKAEGSYYDK